MKWRNFQLRLWNSKICIFCNSYLFIFYYWFSLFFYSLDFCCFLGLLFIPGVHSQLKILVIWCCLLVAFCLFRVASGSFDVVPLCSGWFRFSQTRTFYKIFWLTQLLKMSFTLDVITKFGKRYNKVAQFWCIKK